MGGSHFLALRLRLPIHLLNSTYFRLKRRWSATGKSGVNTSRELPGTLLPLVEAALAEAETWLVQNKPAGFRDDLLALYFRLHSFRRTAELYDERYVTIIEDAPAVKVRLFCLDPSHLLREALVSG